MDHTKTNPALRLILCLLASMLMSVVGLLLVRSLVPPSWLQANNEVAGNYLQTLGTIYAVLLAFVVFVVWQQHNETRSAVEGEANELSDLCRTIEALPGAQGVQDRMREYIRVVIDEEWEAMARGCSSERAALALSIAFMLFLVADLDNPFWGSWQVQPDAFRRAFEHRRKTVGDSKVV